jgi:hypothetical protein
MTLVDPAPFLFGLAHKYDLLWVVLLLAFAGLCHFFDFVVWTGFKLLGGFNEAYYGYKIRCLENKRRYEKSLIALCDGDKLTPLILVAQPTTAGSSHHAKRRTDHREDTGDERPSGSR